MRTDPQKRYRIFQTPHGPGGFVYDLSPFRIKRIYLPRPTKGAILKRMADDPGIGPIEEGNGGEAVEKMARALSDYFTGRPIAIDWQKLDLTGLTPLQREVLRTVAAIPFGAVRSYGEIARMVGRPKAGRFVGSVMALNPFPILIPCHRVVRKDGSVGGFGGGPVLKKAMIEMESAAARS